jgi:hypothetical protein
VGAGEVFHGGPGLHFVGYFGHGLEVVLVAVVEGVGEEVIALMLEILLNVKVVLVILLEP